MTSKQNAVARDLLENTGKSVSKAMLDAGFAPSSAKNPQQLTRSKGWQKLLQSYLPDKKLIEKHKKLLDLQVIGQFVFSGFIGADEAGSMISQIAQGNVISIGRSFDKKGETTIVYFSAPDSRTQIEALKLAYKLKGRLNQNVSVSGDKVIAMFGSPNGNSGGHSAS